ncbi:MAG: shikimate kinase [Candidatus Omnitrophica bacterium]|nr:shikimate kinase [Candidatus Omnitrophota bacterium]
MLKTSKNIVLIGFMASGKTFASRELARRLNRERISTDEWIEKREARAIADIFAQSGEPYFRKIESEVVREIAMKDNLVVDCGGGVVINKDNLKALKANGIIFYLYASPESVFRRTRGKTDRPLLNVPNPKEKIQQLLAVRDPHYREADFVVDSNEDNIGKVVDDILTILNKSS